MDGRVQWCVIPRMDLLALLLLVTLPSTATSSLITHLAASDRVLPRLISLVTATPMNVTSLQLLGAMAEHANVDDLLMEHQVRVLKVSSVHFEVL